MAMVVNHNIPALQTYNTVNRTNAALEKSIQKLSTGLRINSAADDAAGLAISEKMRSQINGMDRAVSNAQDGISMIQTAEGALNETHDILQRMRELSVQAANDTLTSQDRGYIQLEIDELRDEVTRIGNTTQFNKKKLLNGDAAVLWSSDNLNTKAIINGGLRSIDQFGQKVVTEGNYKIKINANVGQGEVQKSDIFKVKHENVVMNKNVNPLLGMSDVEVKSVPAGSYKVTALDDIGSGDATANLTGVFGVTNGTYTVHKGEFTLSDFTASASNGGRDGAITLTVGGTDLTPTITATGSEDQDAMGAKIAAALNAKDGVTATYENKKVTVTSTAGEVKINASAGVAQFLGAADDSTAATEQKTSPEEAQADFKDTMVEAKAGDSLTHNASILFEVTGVNTDAKVVTVKASVNRMTTDGSVSSDVYEDIVLQEGTPAELGQTFKIGSADDAFTVELKDGFTGNFHVGDKFTYSLAPKAESTDLQVNVEGTQATDWPENWGAGVTTPDNMAYTLNLDKDTGVGGKDVHLNQYYLNENTGEVMQGEVILKTTSDFNKDNTKIEKDATFATFDAAYVGQVAVGDVALRDLDKFWTSEGVFMLDDPQTITITQGDGKQASVTLYATDTLNDVANKLNDAIANDLGQGQYVSSTADGRNFVNFVSSAGKDSESVQGTFLVRSLVPGDSGTLSFSGSENVINAFSLNTIQNAKESRYTVSVNDAHTGESIASNVQVTGNKLVGVIHPNVDVQFDAMAGVKATWDDTNKKFTYSTTEYTTTLHLSDNTTVFQIGANEGEDMGVHIGDMRATALGIDKVNVTNREAASRSITILDNAIDKVSTQRAKLGAYQNRLEHTVNNLNTAAENITSAESRIRDADMAKEMMNFTKLQIMLQAGTSMLAQANQLPQNVMALVR